MKSMQGSQVVGRNCTTVTFTVLSGNCFKDMILDLTVNNFNVSEWTYLNFIHAIFPISKNQYYPTQ